MVMTPTATKARALARTSSRSSRSCRSRRDTGL
jgi:hypothetical protein